MGVVDVVERDADGDLFVRLAKAGDDAPSIRLAPGRGEAAAGAPGLGDRLLVRFETLENGELEARLIKRLGQSAHRILGVVRKARREIRVEPVDRRSKESLLLAGPEARDLRDGDLVLAQVGGAAERRYGPKRGKLLEVVGREDDPRAASLIAIHAHGIPTGFSAGGRGGGRGRRAADAGRPHRPARPAADHHRSGRRPRPRRRGLRRAGRRSRRTRAAGSSGSPSPTSPPMCGRARRSTATAREKGNSVYFPDRVEPMLPERLSAGLCSLREGEDRACLAVRMVFDAEGRKRSHRFVRGLMRSAAKLSYEQAQAAIDGRPDDDDRRRSWSRC